MATRPGTSSPGKIVQVFLDLRENKTSLYGKTDDLIHAPLPAERVAPALLLPDQRVQALHGPHPDQEREPRRQRRDSCLASTASLPALILFAK